MKRCMPNSVEGLAPPPTGFPSGPTSTISPGVTIPLFTEVRVVRKFPLARRVLTFPSVAVTNPRAARRWQMSTSSVLVLSAFMCSHHAEKVVDDVVFLEGRHHVDPRDARFCLPDKVHGKLHTDFRRIRSGGSHRLPDLV